MNKVEIVIPTQCHLWQTRQLNEGYSYDLTLVEVYVQESHLSRKLFQCKYCGQYYYREFYEEMMFDGDDLQYITYIPVNPTKFTIDTLNGLSQTGLFQYFPRLHDDYGLDKIRKIYWVGKEIGPKKTTMNIVDNAAALAVKWHKGKVRKVDDTPYIMHPLAVAGIVAENEFGKEAIAAAFCHDLLEDTDCPESTIEKECGKKVLEIVKTVSHNKGLSWEEKRIKYVEAIKAGPVEARIVCCADKIHNLRSLLVAYEKQGQAIWKKFSRGKEKKLWFEKMVLNMLKQTWKHPLIQTYERLIGKMEELN
jgi:hypothetical protein